MVYDNTSVIQPNNKHNAVCEHPVQIDEKNIFKTPTPDELYSRRPIYKY